jgi:predicted AAA+ superfamily ATPase
LAKLLPECLFFTKRAKRRLVAHPKFYYFEPGVYRTLRPKGPLDSPQEIDGPVLETLFIAHLRAINDYYRLDYQFYYWRTHNDTEVDFIAYGNGGLFAFEIKRKRSISSSDLTGLKAFAKDYEMAKLFLLYGGNNEEYHGNITVLPFEKALFKLRDILGVTEV